MIMATKIKVNIPFDVNRTLENDMKSFEFIKKDGNINKNKFVNHLLKNYYLVFSLEEDKLINRIESQLLTNYSVKLDRQFAHNIVSLIRRPTYEEKYYNDFSIQFILTKENEKIFKMIEKYYLKDRSISQYFREMFISYTSHKQDYREKLLFPDLVDKIETAIKNKKKIIINTSDEKTSLIDPFALDQTKEEVYNYLVGVSIKKDGSRCIISRKLFKIYNVISTNEDVSFTEQEKYLLTITMEHGSQFPINKQIDAIIELTKKGEKFYNDFYLNRPKYLKKEGNRYYFNCSFTQLEFYFFKFGSEAKVIAPISLKNKFSKKYFDALDNYKKNKTLY